MSLSFPYPPARVDGYWAPVTSTINWCEGKSLVSQMWLGRAVAD